MSRNIFRKWSVYFVVLSCLFVMFSSCYVLPAHAERGVRIGGSEYPISTFTENGKIIGLDYEIVEAALKEAGITSTERVIAPWRRIVNMLDNQEVDMVVPMVFSEERAKKYLLSPSIRTRYNIVLLKKTSRKKIHDIGGLTGLTVGKCMGFVYQDAFESAVKKGSIRTESCVDNEMGLKKLNGGRMDALMIGEDSAAYLIGKLSLENELIVADYRAEKSSHVAFNTANRDLYAAFVSGLEKAHKKGVIDKIVLKWKKRYELSRVTRKPK